MKIEIEQYIIRNYNELMNVCKRVTQNNAYAGDLLNDVLLQLYERDEINLTNLDDNSIKYYIIRCITMNWHSKTSPFYRKVRRESSLYDEITYSTNLVQDDTQEQDHLLMDTVEQMYGGLSWFHKDILSRYLVLKSYRSVSQQTTIPITSIKRYVDEAKKEIRLNTFKKIKDE